MAGPLVTNRTRGLLLGAPDPSERQRVALVDQATSLTWAELADRVEHARRRLGEQPKLIGIHLDRQVDAVVWYLAAIEAGHRVLVLPTGASAHELTERFRPDLRVVDGTLVGDTQAPARHPLHPDLAVLLSTSGSTGSPKLVRLSCQNLTANADAIVASLGLDADDVAITSLPLSYCYGLSVLHAHLRVGATVVLSDASVTDPAFWTAVDRHGVTNLAGVPHTFDLLDACPPPRGALERLRLVTQAGGRLAADRVTAWARRCQQAGTDFVVMYGQTEATARMAVLAPSRVLTHPDAVGVAVPGGRFEVVGSDGRPGVVGPLRYRGPNVMLGYASRPADLAQGSTMPTDESGEPYLDTGDLASVDEHGLVRLAGRARRIIKPGGHRIDLTEIETRASQVGLHVWCAGDDDHGIVVGIAPAQARRASEWLATTVDLPHRLRRVVALDEPPRTPNGKVDEPALVRMAAAVRDRSDAAGPAGAAEVFRRTLGIDHVGPDDSFVSLQGDSLSYVETATRLEATLGTLPADWHRLSVRELDAATRTRARRGTAVETSVVVRAAAMVLIVSRHLDLLQLAGGAHVLLALAGFNVARFLLDDPSSSPRRWARAIGRLAVPTVAWSALMWWSGEPLGWSNLTLTHSLTAAPAWTPAWRYWFIEATVHLMVVVAVLASVPALRRIERRAPFATALAALGVSLIGRPDAVVFGDPYRHLNTVASIGWLFALGWVVARATGPARRAAATGLVLVLVPGFFGDGRRDLIVLVGLLALTWIPRFRMPRLAAGAIAEVAGASLAIYLVHWELYPRLLELLPPGAVLVVCLGAGVATWRAAVGIGRRLTRRAHQPPAPAMSRTASGRGSAMPMIQPWT